MQTTFYKMAQYTLTTNGGRCTAHDVENGVTLDWIAGDFYGTRDAEIDADAPAFRGLSAPQYVAALARVQRAIYDYVAAIRPELL